MALHEDETRKHAFGLDAAAYDAHRPRYPRALIDRIAEHAGLGPESRALEIGCGTGIATLPFAELGCSIRGIELSEAMAAVARAKLARFPRVVIETARFEDWRGDGDFDLVFCAQAWHWLPPHARYQKTRALLRASGTLAVFANWDTAFIDQVQPIYRRYGFVESHADECEKREEWGELYSPDVDRSIEDVRAAITMSRAYSDIEFHRFPWARTFNASEYLALLRTMSFHSTLPPDVREPFLADIGAAITAAGGTVTQRYEAVLLLARPAPEASAR